METFKIEITESDGSRRFFGNCGTGNPVEESWEGALHLMAWLSAPCTGYQAVTIVGEITPERAAAPDMLAALESALLTLESFSNPLDNFDPLADTIATVRAAIAKARGS